MRSKRRLALGAALALVASLVVAAVAYAANVYRADGFGKPYGSGSPKKPLPKNLVIEYWVDSDDNTVPVPVKSYEFRIQGGTQFAKYFPTCPDDQVNNADPNVLAQKCKKARVGKGTVIATIGKAGQPLAQPSRTCQLDLVMYNMSRGRVALRLDPAQGPFQAPATSPCPMSGQSIIAKWTKPRVRRKPSSGLKFTVPQELLHPGGLDVPVRYVKSEIFRQTRVVRIRGKRVRVPYIASIACDSKKYRYAQVVFTGEDGKSVTVSRRVRC